MKSTATNPIAAREPDLQEALRRYEMVSADLLMMPEFKEGTSWHAARKRDREHILNQLARLGLVMN